jgi:hypothetical protein
MKNAWIAILLAAGVIVGNAAQKQEPDVVVYLHAGTENVEVIRLAQGQAQQILAGAGIRVEWRLGTPRPHGGAEVIEAVLTEHRDQNFRPGALAFATLGKDAGTRIEIFYNRIRASGRDSAIRPILAHVLAHEITHILEGVERHSETGIMKAHWSPADLRAMSHTALPFGEEDLLLLHTWHRRSPFVCDAGRSRDREGAVALTPPQ